MESFLQREGMDQIEATFAANVYNLQNPVVYVPIRHHSPVCSIQLLRTIEAYKPDALLIEGPGGSNHLLDVLGDERTKPPVSIYYARMSDEERRACYYPLLAYSPEYVALREAKRRGLPASFIDLDFGSFPLADSEAEPPGSKLDGRSLHDETLLSGASFMQRLCEKTGSRHFDELWERLFETGGLRKEPAAFFRDVFVYCTLARLSYRPEELTRTGDLLREKHMRKEIAKAAERYGKVLVITGGFHTWGLLNDGAMASKSGSREDGDGGLPPKNPGAEQVQAYPMAYTFEEADRLNGYASGMPYVNYYDTVWREMKSGHPEPFAAASVSMLVQLLHRLRGQSEAASVADAIEARTMAEGLARLRGKQEAGVYELLDGVLSAFVKGERAIATSRPLDALRGLLTGDRIGEVAPNDYTSPLVRDFQQSCAALRLRIGESAKKQRTLQLYAKPSHRSASQLFHRADYLGIGFCRRLSGPDWLARSNVNVMRESWEYGYSSLVEARLVECSLYGGTMREAAAGKLEEELGELPDHQSGEAAALLLRAFVMGLEDTALRLFGGMEQFLEQDGSFLSLSAALQRLSLLREQRGLLGIRDTAPLDRLVGLAYARTVDRLHTLADSEPQEAKALAEHVKLLVMLALLDGEGTPAERLIEELRALLAHDTLPALLEGSIAALLADLGGMPQQQVAGRACAYMYGGDEDLLATGPYLQGVFLAARDVWMHHDGLLSELDRLLGRVTHEQFVRLTPELRQAFALFTSREAEWIADKVATLVGVGAGEWRRPVVEEAELLLARSMDEAIREEFERWGMTERRYPNGTG